MEIYEILGIEKQLFCDDKSHTTMIALNSLTPQLEDQREKCQALHAQLQFQKENVERLDNEIKNMKTLLEECMHLKLNIMEKKEFSQTYLSRLNKSLQMKEGDLLCLKNRTQCSKKDETKFAEQKKFKQLLEHLFSVKICTKYSNMDTVTIMLKQNNEVTNKEDKENYFQMGNNPGEAWLLLESVNKHRIKEMQTLQNGAQ